MLKAKFCWNFVEIGITGLKCIPDQYSTSQIKKHQKVMPSGGDTIIHIEHKYFPMYIQNHIQNSIF